MNINKKLGLIGTKHNDRPSYESIRSRKNLEIIKADEILRNMND